MTINAKLFAQAGEAMFGPDWRQPLAELIGMNIRTVRRISAALRDGEDYPINPSLAPVLADHLRAFAERSREEAQTAEGLAKQLED